MQSPFQTIGSLDALHSADVLTLTPLSVDISKQERIRWIHETIARFRYAVLTREDKGLVRRYLQHMTGYSRAQIARHIADALTHSVISDSVRNTGAWKAHGMLAALLLLATLLATSSVRSSNASVLRVLTPEKAAQQTATGSMLAARTSVVSAIVSDATGTVAYPLVAMNETTATQDGKQIRVTRVSDAATLLRNVAARRASRLAALLGNHAAAGNPVARPVPAPLAVYPAYPASQLHGAAPDNAFTALPGLWSSIGLGTQGQILMIQNGRPVWHDFPYMEQIRTLAPQGNEPTRRAGGQRSGGAPQSSNTTTIINNTTTSTATAPSGWTDGTDVVYLTTGTDSVGIGTDTPVSTFEVVGSISGASLYVASSIEGAGLTSCDAVNQKLLWDSVTKQFTCGTDNAVGTGLSTAIADVRYVQKQGDTMTGALVIDIENGTLSSVGLNVINTLSGAHIHAEKALTTSGTLVFEGAASGSSLYLGSALRGAGLVDCSSAGTSKLLWNSVSGRFSCGTDTDTDTNTTYTAGQGLTMNGTVVTLNATITGSLVRFQTVSGSTVYAKNLIASSGSIVLEGNLSGGTINGFGLQACNGASQKLLWNTATGKFECGADVDTDTNTTYTAGRGLGLNGTSLSLNSTITGSLVRFTTISGSTIYGNTSVNSSGSITAEGAISGSTLFAGTSLRGAGLVDCDTSSTSKLLWDATSGRFSCGTDQSGGGAGNMSSGNVLTIGDARYVRKSGDTMTGALVLQNGNTHTPTATPLLNARGTISGSTLYANNALRSSGSITAEGAISGSSLYAGTSINGAGLIDCDTSGTSKLLWDATSGRFSCGTDQNTGTTYTAGQGLSVNGTVLTLNATITGSLVRFQTVSGSTIFGKNAVNSSGSITAEGTISGSSLYIAGSVQGAGLTNCVDGVASKLLWNAATGRFSCGTDQSGSSGLSQAAGDARYVQKQGDTMTGALLISVEGGNPNTIGLNVLNTISGAVLHAAKSISTLGSISASETMSANMFTDIDNPNGAYINLSEQGTSILAEGAIIASHLHSSGSVIFDTFASGSSLYISSSIRGAGLVDCSSSGTSKLLWNATTGTFSCGTDLDTDTDTTYTAGQGLTMNGTVVTLNATITGSLVRFQTVSGSTVYAKNLIASSGSIVLEGNLSGGTINGFGLQACNGASQKLLWNTATGKFECGADVDTNTTYTAGQGLSLNGTVITLNSTLTGSLARFTTISGSTIYGKNYVNSSGSITAEGAISGSTLFAGTSIRGAGLVDCDTSSTSKLLWDATSGRFSCGTDTDTSSAPFSTGNVLTIGSAKYVSKQGDTMTGALTINMQGGTLSTIGLRVLNTFSGAIIHAEKSLTSSGTIFATGTIATEGTLSGAALTVMSGNSYFMGNVGFGVTNPQSKIHVHNSRIQLTNTSAGTLSTDGSYIEMNGSSLTIANQEGGVGYPMYFYNGNNLTLRAVSNRVGINISPKTDFEVLGTISGSLLTISGNGSFSGSVTAEGTISGSSLYAGTSIRGAGLSDCDTSSTSKLLWDATSGRFSCGTDQSSAGFSTGQVLTIGDARYVRTSGGTMTGALVVQNGNTHTPTGAALINARGTISGTTLYANSALRSSGSITAEGAISGSSLYAGTSIRGAGLVSDCNAATSALQWVAATGRFSCGTITAGSAFSSGNVLTIGNANYVQIKGDSMTGSLQTPSISLSGVLLTTLNGFNQALNVNNAGIATYGVTRLQSNGNLTNIGSIQSGEIHATMGGTFATKADYAAGSSPWAIVMGDLSGDGVADLAVANSLSDSISVYINTGTGTYRAKVDYATGTQPLSLAMGDLNGDGKADVVASNFASGTVSVFMNNGNGTLAAKVDYATNANARGVAIGDLNGDGKADLAVLSNNTVVSVLMNNGNGTFAPKVDYATGSLAIIVALADLNGDGRLDIATVNFSGTSVSVLLNRGNGTFATKVDYTTGTGPQGLAVGDVNGDGKADLIATNTTANTLSVLMNNGDGTFATKVDYATGTTPYWVAVGDVNGDGKADLATANNGDDTASIFMNNGDGTFAAKVDYPTGTDPRSVAIGDVNRDGKADLAVANNGGSVSILLNNTKTILFASAGTGGTVGIGTSTPGSKLAVSGSVLINPNGTIANTRADAGLALEAVGTISGTTLYANQALRSSGSITAEGAISGSSLYAGTSINGAGLSDCDTSSTSKLLWDSTTGRFSCGTDASGSFSTGNVLTIGSAKYVSKQGDTMTGALVINMQGGNINTIGLKVINTFSGAIVQATQQLRSSGSLSVEGISYLQGQIRASDGTNSAPSYSFDAAPNTGVYRGAAGTLSFAIAGTKTADLYSNYFDSLMPIGVPLGTVSVPAIGERLAGTTGIFFPTTSSIAFTLAGTEGARILANGNVGIGTTTPRGKFVVVGSGAFTAGLSGSTLHAEQSLTSSGSITAEGAISGSSLYAGTSIRGAGLTDCDTSSTSKLLWDATTGRFSCGTVSSGLSSGNVLTLGDSRYLRTAGGTMTGALVLNSNLTIGDSSLDSVTINAATVSLNNDLNFDSYTFFISPDDNRVGIGSSNPTGTLTVEGSAPEIHMRDTGTNFATFRFYTNGFERGAFRVDHSSNFRLDTAGNEALRVTSAGRLGLGTTAPDRMLEVNAADGAALRLSYGDSNGSAVNYGDFSLASDGAMTIYAGGTDPDMLLRTANFSQALFIDDSTGRVGINTLNPKATFDVVGTISGSTVYANSALRSSGSITAEGAISGSSLYAGTSIRGAGLSDCDTSATSKLLWDATTGRFSCGTDQSGAGFSTGQVLTIGDARYLRTSGGTLTGALMIQNGNTHTPSATPLISVRGIMSGYYLVISSGADILGPVSIQNGKDLTLRAQAGATENDPGDLVFLTNWGGQKGRIWTEPNTGTGLYFSTGDITPDLAIDATGRVGIGTRAPDTVLEVIGSISGASVYGKNSLNSSGSITAEGAISGSSLYAGTSIRGAGLADCSSSGTDKLLWNATTGRFSCGTDQTGGAGFGSGQVVVIGDARYVKRSGDTMTGTLVIRSASGVYALGLNVAGTMSGTGLNISGSGAYPIIRTVPQTGTVLMGTGALRSGSGLMVPQLLLSPKAPVLVSTVTTTAAINSMALQGNTIIATAGTVLRSFDVSNPMAPKSLSTANVTSSNPGAIVVQGKYAFIGVQTKIQSFDISNPSAMVPLHVFTPTSAVNALAIQGKYLYSLNTTSARFQVVDIANPANMVAAGVVATGTTPNAIAVQGRYAYITNGGGNTMQIIDLKNPQTPVSIGTTSAGTTPNGIAVQERYAYVINTAGLQIFDISNPASVVTLGSIATGTQAAITVQGRYAYIVGVNGLQTVDISDPRNPVLVSTVSTALTTLNQISVAGRYAYVSYTGGTRLYVYDLGGLYTQNAEIGSLEVGGLTVLQTMHGFDANFQGSISAGTSLFVAGHASFGTGGQVTIGTGGLVARGPGFSGSSVYAATSLQGAGLSDCDTASSSKLLWDATTGRFSCGTDQAGGGFSTGNVLTIGNAKYVSKQGDTMTGALVINMQGGSLGSIGLRVLNTLSGAIIHAEKELTSSGTLMVKQTGTVRGSGALTVVNTTRNGTGAFMSASGTVLALNTNSRTSRHILFGYDANFDTALWRSGAATLSTNGTFSGVTLYAASALRSSGSITAEGAISGSSLYAGTSIRGAGLSDCDTSATSKLMWDATTGRFSCGTDTAGGSFSTGNVLTIGNAKYVSKQGDTMTGALVINIQGGTLGSIGLRVLNTLSGAIIHAEKELTSSGTLMVKQTGTVRGSGALTVVNTTTTGTGAYMASNSAILALDATNTASRHILFGYRGTFDTTLWRSAATVLSTNGTFSGASLYADNTIRGAGLSDCDNASTSKLLWDSTTGRFSCGTDGGGSGGGNFVSIGGDAMTGSLVVPGLNLSGVTLSSINGVQKILDINDANLATEGVTRLTQNGNLVNIGSIQAGSALFTAAGTFPSVTTYTGTENMYSIDLGDINGDGYVDAVAGSLAGGYSRYINNGDGTFAAKSDFGLSGAVWDLELGDFDGDGMLDIASIDGNDMAIFINNGDGTFAAEVSYAGTYPTNISVADFNGDARMDVLVAQNISSEVSVYMNNGDGTFAAAVDYTTASSVIDAMAHDINGDGYPDILAVVGNADVISTFMNKGNGTFAAKVDVNTQNAPYEVTAGDLNGDLYADLVVASSMSNNISVQINNGDGTFASSVDYAVGGSLQDVQVADLNGDGMLDIAAGGVQVLLNRGNGTFAASTLYATGNGSYKVQTADLNNDGKEDIVAVNNQDDNLAVLLNASTPTLSVQTGTGGMVGVGTTTLRAKLTVRNTADYGTGASLYASGAVLTLEASTQSGARTPNLLFGYRGAFDTRITRTSTGSLTFASQTGTLVTLDTERSDATGNVFQIISDASTSYGGPDENKVFRIQANGAVFTDGAVTSNGADYAEWFYSGNEKLKAGEVVCIDITKNNAVKRCVNEADSNVMGIVSTNPAFIGNGITGADGIIPPGYALIGLIGQVPTKVIVSGTGAIRPGDALTPASTPGYARKAMPGESTVGVALEGIQSGEGVINVLISRRNSSMTVDAVGQKVLDTIASMKIGDEVQLMVASSLENLNVDAQIQEEVQKQVSGIKSYDADILSLQTELDDLKRQVSDIGHRSSGTGTTTIVTTGSGSGSGSALAADLTAATLVLEQTLATGGDARIGGDLHIDGTLMASSLFVPNGLSIDGGATVTGTLAATTIHSTSGATIDGTLTVNGDIRISSGSLLFDSGATLSLSDLIVERSLIILGDITIDGLARFFGNVEVHGELRVSGRQAGTVTIAAGTTGSTVLFSSGFTAVPVVTASPNDFVLSAWRIKPVTQTGFTIEFAATQDTDVLFSWHALISMGSGSTILPNAVADDSTIFPMGSDNIPVSSSMYWNACIRNTAIIDADGKPHSCSRYHTDYTWTHPDLLIEFLWNTNITPPLLHLPEGYTVEVTEDADSIRGAFTFGTNEVASSSSSSESSVEVGEEVTEVKEAEEVTEVEEVSDGTEGAEETASSSASSEAATSETSASSATSEASPEELTINPVVTEPEPATETPAPADPVIEQEAAPVVESSDPVVE